MAWIADVALRKIGPVDDLGRRRDERLEQMFCPAGVAGTASSPRLAVIRPNSSKAAEFISSWSAWLDCHLQLWTLEGVEPEVLTALLGDTRHPVALLVPFGLVQSPLETKVLP